MDKLYFGLLKISNKNDGDKIWLIYIYTVYNI